MEVATIWRLSSVMPLRSFFHGPLIAGVTQEFELKESEKVAQILKEEVNKSDLICSFESFPFSVL